MVTPTTHPARLLLLLSGPPKYFDNSAVPCKLNLTRGGREILRPDYLLCLVGALRKKSRTTNHCSVYHVYLSLSQVFTQQFPFDVSAYCSCKDLFTIRKRAFYAHHHQLSHKQAKQHAYLLKNKYMAYTKNQPPCYNG